MNISEFEDKLNILLAKYDYTETVMWGSSAKYSDAIIFCLTKPRRKSDVFLAIGKHGGYKLFDVVEIFPQRIRGLIDMFLKQDAEEWFRGLIV